MFARVEAHSHEEVLGIYHKLNEYFNYLMYVTLLVFILGMLTYGQDFSFLEHAFSHFGRLRTQNGNPNTLAMFIFGIGMILSSLICIKLSKLTEDSTSRLLFSISAAGYLLLIVPCDLLNTIHAFGGALVIGSLWLLAVIKLHELIQQANRLRYYLYHLLLQGTVLPYAFLYAFDSPLCPLAQKFTLAGLIITLKLTLTESRKAAET